MATKKKTENPLTVLQLLCLYVYLSEDKPTDVTVIMAKRFAYLQRFGTLDGFHSGWYQRYFSETGEYFKPRPCYVVCKHNPSNDVAPFKVHKYLPSISAILRLTPVGRTIATTAMERLQQRTRCLIGENC